MLVRLVFVALSSLPLVAVARAAEIKADNQPAQLDIRAAGQHSIRVTLKPIGFRPDFPFTPALVDREYAAPAISLRNINEPVKAQVGNLNVEVQPNPLSIAVTNTDAKLIQNITFHDDGKLSFKTGNSPVLGMGEGGPLPRGNFRTLPVEFDRRGRFDDMRPRWQSDAP